MNTSDSNGVGAAPDGGENEAKLAIRFVNANPAIPDQNVHVMFGANADISGTVHLADGTSKALATNCDYTVKELDGGFIELNEFLTGKIFVSYGTALTIEPQNNPQKIDPYHPDFQDNSGDQRSSIRWDKLELTYQPAAKGSSVINMSASDFFSIPLSLTSSLDGQASKPLGWKDGTSTAEVFAGLAALTNPRPNLAIVPAPATNRYAVMTTIDGQSRPILRIISPANVNLIHGNPYSAIELPQDATVRVVGHYGGVKPDKAVLPQSAYQEQDYDFTASINAAGDIVLNETGEPSRGQTITVKKDDVAKGLYSGDPPYTLAAGDPGPFTNSNSVYDQALSDLIAGYNCGLAGSNVTDPRAPAAGIELGTLMRNETTDAWFSRGPIYGTNQRLCASQLFGTLQSKPAAYNQYAAYLSARSAAYSFPYTDKTAAPLLDITPGRADSITITILPDTAI